jgi:large subunit ribosomal protein L1
MSISSSKEFIDALKNAIQLAISAKKPWRFIQSVELIVTFKDVDVKKQQEFRFRDTVFLPKSVGKESSVCIVVDDSSIQRAVEAGAYRAIGRGDLSKIDKKSAKKVAQECDWVLVRSDLMGLAGRVLGPALGPRGKSPIAIPVNADIVTYIKQYKNAIRLYSKEQPWVGCRIGSENMSIDSLVENAIAVLQHIEEKIKRPLLQSSTIYVKTTSSPAIEVVT